MLYALASVLLGFLGLGLNVTLTACKLWVGLYTLLLGRLERCGTDESLRD